MGERWPSAKAGVQMRAGERAGTKNTEHVVAGSARCSGRIELLSRCGFLCQFGLRLGYRFERGYLHVPGLLLRGEFMSNLRGDVTEVHLVGMR